MLALVLWIVVRLAIVVPVAQPVPRDVMDASVSIDERQSINAATTPTVPGSALGYVRWVQWADP